MVVARPTSTIADGQDGFFADGLTQLPDDVQLGHARG